MELNRTPARWMVEVDERILETLAVYGGLRLYPLHRRLVSEGRVDPPVAYVLLRCKQLREYGLIVQEDGYFVLTDTGDRYLDGALDAACLTPDADPREADESPTRDDAPAKG